MQNYVVRVYRRNPDNKNEVAGIIEKVGTQHQNSFLDLSELQESLKNSIKLDDMFLSKITRIGGHYGGFNYYSGLVVTDNGHRYRLGYGSHL